MATRVKAPLAVSASTRVSAPQVAVETEDDIQWDGSEPGQGYEASSRLSNSERAALSSHRRSTEAEEAELQPLPGLLKVVTTGKELPQAKKYMFEPGVEGTCASVNPAGDTVAVGCRNSNILLLDVANLSTMANLDLGFTGDGTITAMQYRPETLSSTQNVVLMSRADSVVCVHTSTGKILSTRQEQGNKINTLQLSGDGSAMATAGGDTFVRVYDEASGKLKMTLEHGDNVLTTGHSNAVYSLSWVPEDPQLLVSAGWDRSVKVWDQRVQRAVRSVFGPYVCGDAVSVRGGRLLTGSWRNSAALQQWDLASARLMTNMTFFQPEHEACLIYCAKFAQGNMDGIIYAGGSGKKPVLRTYQARGEIIGTMQLQSAMVGVAELNNVPRHRQLLVCCTDRLLSVDV